MSKARLKYPYNDYISVAMVMNVPLSKRVASIYQDREGVWVLLSYLHKDGRTTCNSGKNPIQLLKRAYELGFAHVTVTLNPRYQE